MLSARRTGKAMGRRARPPAGSASSETKSRHLPVELLLKIFRHLPRQSQVACTSVCRHWYAPAREVLYQIAGPFRDLDQFAKFADFAFDVRELDLTGVSLGAQRNVAFEVGGVQTQQPLWPPTPTQIRQSDISLRVALKTLLQRSPKIVRLRLPNMGRVVDDTVAAAISIDRLQELDIAGSFVSDDGIRQMCTSSDLSWQDTKCPPVLRALCIDRCVKMTKRSLEVMARWPALREVSLRGYNPQYTGKAIRSLQKACLARFMEAPDSVLDELTTEYTGISQAEEDIDVMPGSDDDGDILADEAMIFLSTA